MKKKTKPTAQKNDQKSDQKNVKKLGKSAPTSKAVVAKGLATAPTAQITKITKKPGKPSTQELPPLSMGSQSMPMGMGDAMPGAPGLKTDGSPQIKNFRHHPDMESFYRFIHENDLRFEAVTLLDQMMEQKIARRAIKAAKTKAH